MANVMRYNLAQFWFEDEQIITEEFKTSRKLSSEKLKSSSSHTPYAIMFTEEELTWECSKVDPTYRPFFEKIIDEQKKDPTNLATISTYDYNDISGDLITDDVYDDVWVEEISKDNANKPFSVKGGALRKI